MNSYFGQSDIGLTDQQIAALSSIPSTSIPYISTMNQHVGSGASPAFTRVLLGTGSAAAPSLSFTADTNKDTGIYRYAEDNLAISTAGDMRILVGTGAILSKLPINIDDSQSLSLGTGGNVKFSVSKEGKVGVGQSAGTQMLEVTGNVSVTGTMIAPSNDATTPSFGFATGNCGIYGHSLFTVGFSCNSESYGRIGTENGSSIVLGREAGAALGVTDVNGSILIGTSAGKSTSVAATKVEEGRICIGSSAGLNGTDLRGSVVIGQQANEGSASTTGGTYNTYVGSLAGQSTTTGTLNTGFGHQACKSSTTGSSNTCIGEKSDVAAGNTTNAIAIGSGVVAGTNSIVIGNASHTSATINSTKVGINQAAGTEVLEVNGNILNTSGNGTGILLSTNTGYGCKILGVDNGSTGYDLVHYTRASLNGAFTEALRVKQTKDVTCAGAIEATGSIKSSSILSTGDYINMLGNSTVTLTGSTSGIAVYTFDNTKTGMYFVSVSASLGWGGACFVFVDASSIQQLYQLPTVNNNVNFVKTGYALTLDVPSASGQYTAQKTIIKLS
jgi:hypothetical protein